MSRHGQLLLAILLVFGTTGLMMDELDRRIETTSRLTTRWVRTRNGWEKDKWTVPPSVYEPEPHPAVFALVTGVASVAALVAMPGNRRRLAHADLLAAQSAGRR